MRTSTLFTAIILAATMAATGAQQPAQFSPEWYAQFSGEYSQPAEPFRIVGNIHYVGARNISAYLITDPQGHILIDTGTTAMHDVIRNNVQKLGFSVADIRIILSSHAHFDHVAGHAMMKKLTGAQVMAMAGDAEALSSGTDNSALGAVGWTPVVVDRVLKDGDTVALGATRLSAMLTSGHTQGATTWWMSVEDQGRRYRVAILGGTTPNGGVPLINNPRHRTVIEDTQRTLTRLKAETPPDIYLVGHPQAMLAGKVDRIKAAAVPHPLLNRDAWIAQIADADAAFQKRVAEERAAASR